MKEIRTALLSYGMSGKIFHAPFIDFHPGFVLSGAWERSKKNIQNDYPLVNTYNSLDELLADDVELVVVNTPVDTHFHYAKRILESGIHVIVEKAFTTTVQEAVTLRKIAVAQGLKLSVFHNRRWDSDFLTVKDVVGKHLCGEIVEAEIRFDRYNPNISAKDWKESQNAGAGILKDLGSHLIDQAIVLFGYPEAVFADIRIVRENSVVDDQIEIILYYPGSRVKLHAGNFNREVLPAYVMQGRRGSFFKPRADVQDAAIRAGIKPNLVDWGTESESDSGILHTSIDGIIVRKTVPTLPGNYHWFYEGVYKAIRMNMTEPVTADEGIRVMQIIEAAIKSSINCEVVTIS